MVAQTLQVAVVQLEKHGMPASFRSNNCLSGYSPMGGGVDNARGYGKLMDKGYLKEVTIPVAEIEAAGLKIPSGCKMQSNKVPSVVLLVPTELLLLAVLNHTDPDRKKKAA